MNRRKCVLVVGGSHSVHVRVPAGMMREAGYRVVLGDLQSKVSPGADAGFDAIHALDRVTIRWLACTRPAPSTGGDEEIKPFSIEERTRRISLAWRIFRAWLQAGRLLQVVRAEHPGLIHFQSMTAGGMLAYYLWKRMGRPPSARRPGLLTHLWGYTPRFPGIRRREIRVLKEFDHVHTNSPAIARIYREHYEVPNDRISVLVRGINLHTFAPRAPAVLRRFREQWGVPEKSFVVIHNRHLHPLYRVDVAVEAFIELARRGHEVFLLLVRGVMRQETYEKRLLNRLREAGLGERVALLPPVLSAEEMATALQLSHCSVNCVPFDGFPVSILESMFCRAVPVVRNLESYSVFVRDGENALTIDGDARQYAARIEQLVLDPVLRCRLSDAGVHAVRCGGSEEIFRQKTLELVEQCWHEW